MLFDDLIKNLENNKELYKFIYNILVLNISIVYNINNPTIEIGTMLGYLVRDSENNVRVSNQILKEVIYNYMISRTDTADMSAYNFKSNFIRENNSLDMEKVLLRFQQFMKENYSSRDIEFLERHGEIAYIKGLNQLKNYLDIEGLERGYLLIFNFNKNKEYSDNEYVFEEKEIFEVCV